MIGQKKNKPRKGKTTRAERNALEYAVSARDQGALDMVTAAIRHKQVMLAFQPIVSTRDTDRPAFYEGLIRVLDDTGRIIPAKDFMSAVETTELGRQLDCLALELGLETLADQPNLRLSINMSARSIGYGPWGDVLRRTVGGNADLGDRLILEISETSVNQVPDIVQNFMTDMRARNVSFALDDYGAGMTSLRVFRDFDFDFIKLDGSFSRDICTNRANQVLASAVAAIAHKFDMMSIASRVESPADARVLGELGFDALQGFAFGAPTVSPPWVRKAAVRQARG
ncbi:EAL domain-containing protein [Shimia aestuarii]|uniref:EAL domain, c-di-GMP-specific phosphodiesterase class I (Or its enzymatically inactive variant) n=1 Tax=Shimia aestuarii TaxID=254406 RepID=A0A1I4HYB1_9RHOB|nr:EAL domain-containing protein [Shimia aestuarii]SFL47105.1 EAL domain, c-di-GMP-specific phosphodiesterase class I (or its enzymatically inactive variant) [Shimia aestuarii]